MTTIFKDGKIDRDALLAHFKGAFSAADAGFQTLHEPAVDHCIERYNKMIEKFGDKKKEEKENCDHRKGMVAFCMHHHYFKNCPAAAWTSCKYFEIVFVSVYLTKGVYLISSILCCLEEVLRRMSVPSSQTSQTLNIQTFEIRHLNMIMEILNELI